MRGILALLLMVASSVSWADGPACAKRSDLLAHLAKQYREAPAAMGLADNGALLEVFTSPDGETWTVAVTMPNGISCLIATGEQWRELPRVEPVDPQT